ncbi:MAG: hypothetical protein OEV40_13880 [Acidimicrobiia bacterium]|nr:hypothetical protein [Acidimicrobiia bacterium]
MEQRWSQYYRLAESAPAGGLFIHDFVRVDLPFDAVVGAFRYFVSGELIGRLVADAWLRETAEAGRVLGAEDQHGPEPPVDATLGPHRPREGALVIPIAWRPAAERWVPSLQADLELVSFGPHRTHLHVLGLSQLPPWTTPCTDRASLDHRLTVALVRHVLSELAEMIVVRAPELSSTKETDHGEHGSTDPAGHSAARSEQ